MAVGCNRPASKYFIVQWLKGTYCRLKYVTQIYDQHATTSTSLFHSRFIAGLLRKGYMLSRGSITSLLLVHTDTSLHYTRVTTRDVKSSRSKPTWPRGQNFRPQRCAMLAGLVLTKVVLVALSVIEITPFKLGPYVLPWQEIITKQATLMLGL